MFGAVQPALLKKLRDSGMGAGRAMSGLQERHADFPAASGWVKVIANEDGWSIGIGLGLVAVAVALFASGDSLQWLAVSPRLWSSPQDGFAQFAQQAERYLALFLFWIALFGLCSRCLGFRLYDFLPSFAAVLVLSAILCFLCQWEPARRHGLQPPLAALLLGALLANAMPLPSWFEAGLRMELYLKVGIVLLGAELPVTMVAWAAPDAVLRTLFTALTGFVVTFLVASRLGLDRYAAAELAGNGALCSTSGVFAAAAGARKEHAPQALGLVALWAVMALAAPQDIPAVDAAAWVGASRFAESVDTGTGPVYDDFAGAIREEGTTDGALASLLAEGRDAWLGLCFLVMMSLGAARAAAVAERGASLRERMPGFVTGFMLASVAMSVALHGCDRATDDRALMSLLIGPLQVLRGWIFTFAFFSMGMKLRAGPLSVDDRRRTLALLLGVLATTTLGSRLPAWALVKLHCALAGPG